MILVDTSVWIDFLRGRATPEIAKLAAVIEADEVAIGDLILCEILQGAESGRAAAELARLFADVPFVALAGHDIAVKAAANHRKLRALGATVRKTIDVLIGTFCIENGLELLHADRDFEPMERHLGLKRA